MLNRKFAQISDYSCFLVTGQSDGESFVQQTCFSLAYEGFVTTYGCSSGTPIAATNTFPLTSLVTESYVSTLSETDILTLSETTVTATISITNGELSQFAPLIQLVRKASDPSFKAPTSGGLPTNTKIAISVAAPIAVLVLIISFTIALLWRRRLRKSRASSVQHYEKAELDASAEAEKPLDAPQAVELPASERRYELGPENVQELGPDGLQEMGTEDRYELAVPNAAHEPRHEEMGSTRNTNAVTEHLD